jgi:hypothetical protein
MEATTVAVLAPEKNCDNHQLGERVNPRALPDKVVKK